MQDATAIANHAASPSDILEDPDDLPALEPIAEEEECAPLVLVGNDVGDQMHRWMLPLVGDWDHVWRTNRRNGLMTQHVEVMFARQRRPTNAAATTIDSSIPLAGG